MLDRDLRELGRRWKESGTVEDEANYLRALVRSGVTSEASVRLAAYLGHPAAVIACRPGGPSIPADVDEWIRGLEAWSSDLAIWAVAEAALADDPAGRDHYVRLSESVQQRLQSGDLPERDIFYPHHLEHAKLLRLALNSRARDWRYVPDGDPEVVIARRVIAARFPILDANRWIYNHVERTDSGWVHVFRYSGAAYRERRQQVPASEGWEPADGNEACLPDRKGVLANLLIRFADEVEARGRVRAALLPWVLRALHGQSGTP